MKIIRSFKSANRTQFFFNIILWASALGLSPQVSIAQQYIATDSTSNSGVTLIQGSPKENTYFIKEKKNDQIIIHTPRDISEYRLADSIVYKSFKVKINGDSSVLFLQRIVQGKYNVYELDLKRLRQFYIEDRTLVQIPSRKDLYRNFLKKYLAGCERSLRNLEDFKLQRPALKRIFGDHVTCAQNYFPRRRYEITSSFDLTKFAARGSSIFSSVTYKRNIDFSLGAFIDLPLMSSNFAFITGGIFSRYTNSITFEDLDATNYTKCDLVVNQIQLVIPALFRYTFFNGKNCPFLEGGPLLGQQLSNKTILFKYTITKDATTITTSRSSFLGNQQAGFSLGIGMIFKYDLKYSYLMRIGYSRLSPLLSKNANLSVSQISFSTGFLF
jgi:hypothetical protein